MRPRVRHWIAALSAAALTHAGFVVLFHASSQPPAGARATGLSGIEIALGLAGSAPGAANTESAESADDSQGPDTVEPDQEVNAENVVQAPREPKAETKPAPPETADDSPHPDEVEPEREVSPMNTAQANREPKTQTKRMPLSEPKPVSKPRHAAPAPTSQPEVEAELLAESKAEPAAQARADTPVVLQKSGSQGANGKGGTKDRPESGDGDTGAGGGVPGAKRDYFALLSAWLERHKQYPSRAQRRRQEGTVYLRFVVDREGKVLSYQIERTSGYALLDREVEEMIRRATPLPAMPNELAQSRLELVVPVSFYMR